MCESRSGRRILDTVDRLRLNDPGAAVALAETEIGRIEEEYLADLMGLYGAALRRQGLIDEAEHAIHRGWVFAQERGDQASEARQLKRLAFVDGDRGELSQAIMKTSTALTSFQTQQLLADVGRCWGDLAIWYSRLFEPERSIAALQCAADLLPDNDHRYQYSVRLGMAHCLYKKRSYREASDWLAMADRVSPPDTALKASRVRLEAGLRFEMGESCAVGLFQEAVDAYLEVSDPLNAAVCSIEMIKALLQFGQVRRSRRLAKNMARFIQPLKHNKIVAGALLELTRHALRPVSIPRELISQVAGSLERAAAMTPSQEQVDFL